MNQWLRIIIWIPSLFVFINLSCNKADVGDEGSNANTSTDQLITADKTIINDSNSCPNAPNYGDSIVYLKPKNNGDFLINPVNNSDISGVYISWPEGLKLNRNTGAINLSQSETGVRYNIAFIKTGSTDTCVSQLIVGGLTYLDAIYVLEQNDTLAKPVFNADPASSSICDASDDTDYPDNNGNGSNKCIFDDDVPGQRANDQKLRVRTKSGFINLKKSFEDGLFGKNPKNGDKKNVQIRYRLNDGSQKATQKLTVQVMYYDKMSNIPPGLQQEVNGKRNSLFTYRIIKGKPRPPLLIIAGYLR